MKQNDFRKQIVLYAIALGTFLVILLLDPIIQDQQYHNFADQRSFFAIPNFFDVTTNIFFAFIGIIGMYFTLNNNRQFARWAWFVFFFGVFTLCFSSGYYHWIPNDATLFWDRLSLTLIFTSMVIALLSEFISFRIEKFFLVPALVFGVCSIIYWHIFEDLRIYYWVQLAPIMTIPLLMILYSYKNGHKKYLIMTLIFYMLAKIVEIYDKEIFIVNNEILSGHTLKHIFAAAGAFSILLMIKKNTTR
jgi:predicted membrane channel-forming protein YqfA (hemolysin III family)